MGPHPGGPGHSCLLRSTLPGSIEYRLPLGTRCSRCLTAILVFPLRWDGKHPRSPRTLSLLPNPRLNAVLSQPCAIRLGLPSRCSPSRTVLSMAFHRKSMNMSAWNSPDAVPCNGDEKWEPHEPCSEGGPASRSEPTCPAPRPYPSSRPSSDGASLPRLECVSSSRTTDRRPGRPLVCLHTLAPSMLDGLAVASYKELCTS